MSETTKAEDLSSPRICKDCGGTFTLTEGEQEFYTLKMEQEPFFKAPKRCKSCIAKKKAAKQSAAY